MRLAMICLTVLGSIALAGCGGANGGYGDEEGATLNSGDNSGGTDNGSDGGSDGGDTGNGGGGQVLVLSHRSGEDCMSCHSVGGAGSPAFSVAGTVFRSNGTVQTNATVNLYIQNTNTLTASLQTDDSGNF